MIILLDPVLNTLRAAVPLYVNINQRYSVDASQFAVQLHSLINSVYGLSIYTFNYVTGFQAGIRVDAVR